MRTVAVIVAHGPEPVELLEWLTARGIGSVCVLNKSGQTSFEVQGSRTSDLHGLTAYRIIGPNVGYGTGLNIGAALAHWAWQPEWLLICNPDLDFSDTADVVISDAIAASDADTSAIGFIFSDGDERSSPVRSIPGLAAFTSDPGMPQVIGASYPKGAFFAVRADVFRQLGGFDPEFFLYSEETDLFARFFLAGNRLTWINAEQLIWHRGGEATSSYTSSASLQLGHALMAYYRKHFTAVGWRISAFVDGCRRFAVGALKLATGSYDKGPFIVGRQLFRGLIRRERMAEHRFGAVGGDVRSDIVASLIECKWSASPRDIRSLSTVKDCRWPR